MQVSYGKKIAVPIKRNRIRGRFFYLDDKVSLALKVCYNENNEIDNKGGKK